MDGLNVSGRTPNVNITLEAMKEVQKEEIQEQAAEQVESQEGFMESCEEMTNPFASRLAQKEKEVEKHSPRVEKAMKMGLSTEKALLPIEKIKDSAQQFQRRNPEMQQNALVTLRERLKEGATKEEILSLVNEFYTDATLADEALDFLLETTEGELAEQVKEAKDELNQERGREILAGKNIANIARQGAEKGLGTAGSLRDLYRDITGNPRDSPTLFDELSKKYAFKDLQKVMSFLLHSLGADMKSKGSSIPQGELHRLMTETRSLQAILGVYRFFRGRMPLMDKMFARDGLQKPSQLTFENMSKQFMQLAGDRYPTSAKVLQGMSRLGIEKWIQAKIIALSQFRDAIRQVAAGQVYKSMQHRDELYNAILEALEELEDELEELFEALGEKEEEEEGKDGKKKKKKEDEDEEEEKKKKK